MADADRIVVRGDDCREIWRTSFSRPQAAIKRAINGAKEAWTAEGDGEIICIFGVSTTSVISNTGTPWLLGSDLILECPYEFLGRSKEFINRMLEHYRVLQNYVDAENVISIRWLRWMGFDVTDETEIYGMAKKPFHHFEMRK